GNLRHRVKADQQGIKRLVKEPGRTQQHTPNQTKHHGDEKADDGREQGLPGVLENGPIGLPKNGENGRRSRQQKLRNIENTNRQLPEREEERGRQGWRQNVTYFI